MSALRVAGVAVAFTTYLGGCIYLGALGGWYLAKRWIAQEEEAEENAKKEKGDK
jgi:hypothetical protein